MPLGKAQRLVFGETLAEMGVNDPRIVVLDGDLGNSTRADIFEKAFPHRFFQMGIAEQNMLGVAAGMAQADFEQGWSARGRCRVRPQHRADDWWRHLASSERPDAR